MNVTGRPLVRSTASRDVLRAPGAEGSCWPTASQELLLKASLFEGAAAEAAWDAWREGVDLEQIDEGSFRLLPLLYANLVRQGINSPLLPRLKGVYRHAWFRNQVLFRHLAELVEKFEAQGIRTLLLKGAALSLATYRDDAVRPMADGDLLVQPRDATLALTVLRQTGWLPQPEPRTWPPRHRPSWPFKRRDGQEIDLHWHVLAECLGEDADGDFWDAAMPVDLRGARTRVLCPGDQLLHVIVHGLVRNAIPPIRWVADAAGVLNHSGPSLDWERLFRLARERRFAWTLRLALDYLRNHLRLPVPTAILEQFASHRATIGERLEHWSKVEPGATRLACRLWFAYSRSGRAAGERRTASGFQSYLQDFWKVDGSWPLTKLILGKATHHTRTLIGGRSLDRQSAPAPR